jgi:hypothetical protein
MVSRDGSPQHDATMSQQTAGKATAGGALRAGVAAAAAAALLLQLLVMPPLAMRMLSGLARGAWSSVLCTSDGTARTGAPARDPQLPASPHHHDTCLLCQGYPAALGLVAVAVFALAAAGTWRRAAWMWRSAATPPLLFGAYRPRAPPAFG